MSEKDFKFKRDGKNVTKNDIADLPITVAINDDIDKNTIIGFDSDNNFNDWIKGFRHKNKISEIQAKIKSEKEHKNDYNEEKINKFKRASEEIIAKINQLSSELKLPVSSEDLIKEAKRRKIIGTTILYADTYLRGDWRILTSLPCPDFRWMDFNDKTSSMWVTGAGVLNEHTWYGGRAFWFVGLWARFDMLSMANFNDIASSGYSTT